MNTLQYTITLYIHPDSGPITPVEINMMEIENEVLQSNDSRGHDTLRIQGIMKRITANEACKNLHPERKQGEIASIISRLRNAASFAGIVLRVPGIIEEKSAAASGPSGEADEIKRLANEVARLKKEYEQTVQNHANKIYPLTSRIQELGVELHNERESTRFLARDLQRAKDEANRTRAALSQKQNEMDKLKEEMQKKIDQLIGDRAMLQTQLDKANQSSQTSTLEAVRKEMSSLRQQVISAEKAEQQLQQTIKQKDKVIADLRKQLQDADDNNFKIPVEQDENDLHL